MERTLMVKLKSRSSSEALEHRALMHVARAVEEHVQRRQTADQRGDGRRIGHV
jgi:hypothetical protein